MVKKISLLKFTEVLPLKLNTVLFEPIHKASKNMDYAKESPVTD